MGTFEGLARPRGGFASVASPRAGGFKAGLGLRQVAVAPAVVLEEPPPALSEEAGESSAGRDEGDQHRSEKSAIESTYEAREQIRAREHQMLLAELESERKRLRDASARLGQLAAELTRVRASLLGEMRAQAGDVLLAGAQALATRALAADPSLLLAMVNEAVETLGGRGAVVRVNPDDVERVTAAFGEAATVIGDESVHAGCICEGAIGTIDRRFDTANAALVAETAAWKRTS